MSLANALHPLVIPLVPLLAGCLARVAPGLAHRTSAPALAGTCALALVASSNADALARLDTLATTMAVLVSFIGAVVLRFASRYLEGDPGRARFLSWMNLTLAAVLTLVVSNHLLLLLGAWTATSLCLHRLLLHHPHRAGAVFAARKKFVFSRIAECSLLAAALLLHAGHDTWRIDELAASIAGGNHAGLPAAAFLLAFCAMLKSAQFPFHSWLPDTMDTPTPVSALMHAGIVNAGGFLILRMAPVFTAAPSALHLLAVVGTFTAVFGAIVMLAQPAVKRSLAFSTIAQMGFMMIQCGLGAWGLALLHLVAHSLYKAHAFLRAGSAVSATPRAAIPLATPALVLGFISATIIVTGLAFALRPLAPDTATSPVFLAIVAFALAYGIGRSWSGHARSLPLALVIATCVAALACSLHLTAAGFLTLPAPPPSPVWLIAIVGTAFALLFLFQALLWRASAHPLGRRLYVHALNGFYVGPLANRLLNRLWPTQPLA
jgi:NAD(P)H-quinone oxidoreductase subunit 5